MLIAIEGADGSGKTTLIERLRKNSTRYFLIVRSSGYPHDQETRNNYLEGVEALRVQMVPAHVVCDRYIAISESIYGPIIRKTPKWSDSELETELSPLDAVVYCRPPSSVIFKAAECHPQMAGVLDNQLAIVEEYDRRMDYIERFTSISVLRYDYSDPSSSVEDVAKMMLI